jgi:hypothetical protein
MHSATRDPGGPRSPPGQHSGRPSSEVRLARGIDAPSGEDRLARGLYAPSGGVPLARGLNLAPRARSASLEGQASPRAGSASLDGTHTRVARAPARTCSCTRVRAFNALTPQDRAPTLTRLGITPRRCSANSLEGTHPRRCSALCGKAGVSSVTLCRLPSYD